MPARRCSSQVSGAGSTLTHSVLSSSPPDGLSGGVTGVSSLHAADRNSRLQQSSQAQRCLKIVFRRLIMWVNNVLCLKIGLSSGETVSFRLWNRQFQALEPSVSGFGTVGFILWNRWFHTLEPIVSGFENVWNSLCVDNQVYKKTKKKRPPSVFCRAAASVIQTPVRELQD